MPHFFLLRMLYQDSFRSRNGPLSQFGTTILDGQRELPIKEISHGVGVQFWVE
jgi:hypothetical protein